MQREETGGTDKMPVELVVVVVVFYSTTIKAELGSRYLNSSAAVAAAI